jgi:two-component system, sensor histidine kinase and response regulator
MNNKLILLIEDEVVLANNYRQILEYSGFDVFVVHAAEDGLNFCKNVKPDLVLCDIMLGDMDGYGFLAQFKAMGHHDVPFLFLTAMSDNINLRKGMLLGADDYLTKPISAKDLVDSINSRIQRNSQLSQKLSDKIQYYVNAIALKDDSLRKVAFNESHKIRGPLTTIMAIVTLIDSSPLDEESTLLFQKLMPLCNQLDAVIHESVQYIEAANL